MNHTATELEKAYLAGLFDGEGCIGLYYSQRRQGLMRYAMSVSIGMCDPQGVDLAISIYRGSRLIRQRKPPHRPMHCWVCVSDEAERFLMDVTPYLRVKTEQAKVVHAVSRDDAG